MGKRIQSCHGYFFIFFICLSNFFCYNSYFSATQWLFFALFATELIWVSAIAYSMSTVVKRSLMHQAIAAYMGFTIASSSTSGSGSSGSRSRSQRGTESIDSGAL